MVCCAHNLGGKEWLFALPFARKSYCAKYVSSKDVKSVWHHKETYFSSYIMLTMFTILVYCVTLANM